MANLSYIKMCLYPSQKQRRIIDLNCNISRVVYNKMVAIDRELYQLSKIKLPIQIIQDRIVLLKKRKKTQHNLANHYIYMNNPNVDSRTRSMATRNYQAA